MTEDNAVGGAGHPLLFELAFGAVTVTVWSVFLGAAWLGLWPPR